MPNCRHRQLLTVLFIVAAASGATAAEWSCRPAADGGDWECRDFAAGTAGDDEAEAETPPWDWYPIEALNEELRCRVAPGCHGIYIEPPRTWPEAELDPADVPLQASAARSESLGSIVTLTGDVELRKGSLSLDAGRAEYNRLTAQLELSGGVVMREPGRLLRGEIASINTLDGLGRMEAASYLHYESGLRATAARIDRRSENTLLLRDATYTQCPPGDTTWLLSADRIKLDFDSGRGVARNGSLRVQDVPVMYIPWLDFPIDERRATGLLWPSFKVGSEGVDVSVPYYINLAPNYDMTLIPRYIQDRGAMLESEFRYLDRYGEWQLSGAYLPDDDRTGDDRWLVGLNEQGLIAQRWQTAIDYTKVSDDDYFSDLGIASLAIRRATYLNQQAAVSYLGDRWRSRLNVQRYQNIASATEPYLKLPQWTLEYSPEAGNFELEPVLNADATNFDNRDSFHHGGTEETGLRKYGDAGLRYPMLWRAGFLTPTLRMRHVSYVLDDGAATGNPETTSPTASVDAGVFLERPFGERLRWLQTLEPRLYYLWSDYENGQGDQPDFDTTALAFSYQQMFRDSRFNGYDRIDDANQLTASVRSRFINNEFGREVASVAIGQQFYFSDRRVQLPGDPIDSSRSSDVATELRLYPTENSFLNADQVWDTNSGRVTQATVRFHYRAADDSLYNLGYSLRRDSALPSTTTTPVKQLDASAALPLGSQWHIFARWQYDLREKRSLENLAGFAYQNCCWTARVVFQRSAEPVEVNGSNEVKTDEAVLLEFQLQGLGGIGDKIGELLSESIFGYRDDE